MKRFSSLAAIALVATPIGELSAQDAARQLTDLREGSEISGFRAEAVYLNASNAPLGGRFVHELTGFTLDFLQIQSVPQAFIWVNSYPTSDMGEPHTQEHLLLGKGNKGRYVADLETMSLGVSSAFVQGWRTAYHFHTSAGPDVFFNLLEKQVDALLYPDYTDEEIRREVRNFGVAVDSDGRLRLEEKGTVYNEMVSSFERPTALPFRALQQAWYGADHPLSWSAGGFPAAIREMQPEDIRRFHRDNYQLGNMGMVASFPLDLPLLEVLARTDSILMRLQGDRPVVLDFMTQDRLPAPATAPAGQIRFVEYPHQNPQQPSTLLLGWPPHLELPLEDQLLLELFLANLAGDATTNLYRVFIDSEHREVDTGARSVSSSVSRDLGHPITIALSDASPALLTEARVREVRERVLTELQALATFSDGSAELREFNERLRSRVIESRRSYSNFVDTPPGFGQRGTSSTWAMHLHRLNLEPGFQKSLVLTPELERIEARLTRDDNIWRDLISRWKLLETAPFAIVAVPSPELIAREQAERRQRADAELARLRAEYGRQDDQETIALYQRDYDAETARLEALEEGGSKPPFIDTPPLTLDDQLQFTPGSVRAVPLVASTFPNMTGATVGLALRLDAVPETDLMYLAVMPSLLSQVGVVRDGEAIPYSEMRDAMRRQILGVNAYFSGNVRTGRAEMVLRGSGNDAAETALAVDWLASVLLQPDWRAENLPRIRDVVDQALSGLRSTTQRSEESWVDDPLNAYRRQHDPVYLSAFSFLTRTHNAHRLRWQLKRAPAGAAGEAVSGFLERFEAAGQTLSREQMVALVGAMSGQGNRELTGPAVGLLDGFRTLPADAREVIAEVARDLELTLSDVPDDSLAEDWSYLTRQIAADLAIAPEAALAKLGEVRAHLLNQEGARFFSIGSAESQQALQSSMESVADRLVAAPQQRPRFSEQPRVRSRLRERVASSDPVFVGLVNPNTQGGVFQHMAPLASFQDTERDSLLDFLTGRLYGGGGAHSLFMKTWAAGLAYSNGVRSSPASGQIGYYAERVPELPQTLRFVIDELRRAEPDPSLVEYAIAQAFAGGRGALSYEARGESIAADLVDGQGPEVVRGFRKAILEVRTEPRLTEELFGRKERVYGMVLPGYGPASQDVRGGTFLVIGPESQLQAYEEYLRQVESPGSILQRLYPRDFWIVD